MGLFRPYEPKSSDTAEKQAAETPTKKRRSMVIGGRSARTTPTTVVEDTSEPTNAELATEEATQSRTTGPRAKSGPTPTRRQAEAARKQRVNPSLSPKEAKKRAATAGREARMKAMADREAAPEKELLRDYVDSRFSIGEFLLPAVVVLLALSFLNSVSPTAATIVTIVIYVFVLAVLFDGFIAWRGFKKLLAQRLPRASTRGLLFYGMNRMIQIRRFRLPAPRVKRGDQI